MKKLLLTLAAMLTLTACEKEKLLVCHVEAPSDSTMKTKNITFNLIGDFTLNAFTRGSLSSSDNTLTDLWIFDYIGDELKQSIHQSNTDSEWGSPQMTLDYGNHNLYFVASRGTSPEVDNTDKTIIWTKPSDTFWCRLELNIQNGGSESVSVMLARVVTKLKITVNDEVPTGLSSMTLTPTTWYCGLNYTTGEPSGEVTSQARMVSVPSSYIGTSGILSMGIFGFSGSDEWTTDMSIEAKNASNEVVGQANIKEAPLKRNRSTEYSGVLFSKNPLLSISTTDEWDDAYSSEW